MPAEVQRARRPRWWGDALRELGARDPVLRGLALRYPDAMLTSRGDAFGTLARSIVGQQISVKAADSVWRRLEQLLGTVEAAAVARAGAQQLRGCGLSERKAEYLAALAGAFAGGRVSEARWRRMDDAAVIADLTRLRGIGRWSAEMFLIFYLLRPDVLPLADLGLQRAVCMHYNGGDAMELPRIAALGERWRPWRTLATWYLWRSLDPVPVEY